MQKKYESEDLSKKIVNSFDLDAIEKQIKEDINEQVNSMVLEKKIREDMMGRVFELVQQETQL